MDLFFYPKVLRIQSFKDNFNKSSIKFFIFEFRGIFLFPSLLISMYSVCSPKLILLQLPPGVLLDPVEDAITPVSVTQHKTRNKDDTLYGAENAVDGDLETYAHIARPPDTNVGWFRAELGRVYCIREIVHYYDNRKSTRNTHTCSGGGCKCEGDGCDRLPLEVLLTRDTGGTGGSGGTGGTSECVLGDVVRLHHPSGNMKLFRVNEIVIIGSPSDDTSDDSSDDSSDDTSDDSSDDSSDDTSSGMCGKKLTFSQKRVLINSVSSVL